MSDRRVNRTKRQIKESFIKLLSEKEISRITVSEITEQADIGRGTFILITKTFMTCISH